MSYFQILITLRYKLYLLRKIYHQKVLEGWIEGKAANRLLLSEDSSLVSFFFPCCHLPSQRLSSLIKSVSPCFLDFTR